MKSTINGCKNPFLSYKNVNYLKSQFHWILFLGGERTLCDIQTISQRKNFSWQHTYNSPGSLQKEQHRVKNNFSSYRNSNINMKQLKDSIESINISW